MLKYVLNNSHEGETDKDVILYKKLNIIPLYLAKYEGLCLIGM